MNTATVTPELRTTLWMRLLRFFRLKKKREEFTILFHAYENGFRRKDTLQAESGLLKIIKIK